MNRYGRYLFICAALLICAGFIMVFNTTSAEILDKEGIANVHTALVKQLIYGCIGFAAAFLAYLTNYQKLFKWSPALYYGCIGLLLLVFVPGIGQRINGARRWIGIAGLTFQPSELMKLLIPIYYISLFALRQRTILLKDFLRILFLLAIPIVLVIIEPDNGTAVIMLSTLVVMFYLTKVRWVFWGLPIVIFALVGATFASQMKHVTDRIRVYLNPELDLLGKGHQPYQAKIAAGSGGLTGRGFGESLQKLNYLPEARSDYIAAIFAEEFGFIGILTLLLLYMAFALFGFQIASTSKSREGYYLAAVITFLITFQAFLNLGVVSGFLPSKGTNLPLFSQGGSSLIMNMIGLALVLNVSKERKRVEA
ncbi:MAG: putative lipid II flippase FtsW [Simkaniaceae bacterium]|nr:putative lipid II flippase FtsW [Simkaniaceae bacterium]